MARRFKQLRERAKDAEPDIQQKAAAALREVAQLPYGEPIQNWLAQVAFDTSPVGEDGAWREREARRKLADEILTMMEPAPNATGTRRTGK